MSNRGFFLVIEGLDGSGKTEISRRLARLLEESAGAENVKLTFEPHDPSCAGLFIRQALAKKIQTSPRTLALAFAANRSDHVEREIDPFLNSNRAGGSQGKIVICDRYYLSSLVYQTSETFSMADIMILNRNVRRPDLTILLNASDEVCYSRMSKRSEDRELFETELRRTRNKYQEAIAFLSQRGEKIVEVNADGAIPEVLNAIVNVLLAHGPAGLRLQDPS
jgi:dTMP kinase